MKPKRFGQCEDRFCYTGLLGEQFQRFQKVTWMKESTSENVEKEKEVITESLAEVDSSGIAKGETTEKEASLKK